MPMDIKKYRRKIEQSVATARARGSRSRSSTSPADLRELVADKKKPAKARTEALGRLTRAEGRDAIPHVALDRLSDPGEKPALRLAAMRLLQQKQFFSSVAAEWRPAFVEGLRGAVNERRLRAAALDVLSLLKDRPTQERLLDGIRNPKKALVPVSEALRLLGTDVHADVIDAARKVARTRQTSKNKAAVLEAVRILSADPASLGTLERVLANDANAVEVRRVAATAIDHLSPAGAAPAMRARRTTTGKKPAKPKGALATHLDTLRRIRE